MKLQNKDIQPLITFLDTIKVGGRKSLGRTKLKEKLTKQMEVYGNDQTAVIDEFDGWADKEKGQFTTENKELNEALSDLALEEVEITYNTPFKKDFVELLENYEEELQGKNADAYAILYEKLVEEKEKGNE